MRRIRAVAAMLVLAAACSFGTGTAVTVDGVEISTEEFDSLHVNPDELDDDQRAGSALLLVLQESLTVNAESELGLVIPPAQVEAALTARLDRMQGLGVETVLESRNQTTARIRIESELDVLRDTVGAHLVRSESPLFDLDLAYQQYLLANAEVCIRQITLAAATDFDAAAARIEAGEDFGVVAREVSIDPFVGREEGVGAGGDLGCSAPSALPAGLDEATIDAPLNQVTGPVVSSAGIHLLVVYDRTAAELSDVKSDVLEHAVPLQGPDLFRQWAVAVLQGIDVEVNDTYGTWGVLPETDPSPTVVPRYRTDSIVAE